MLKKVDHDDRVEGLAAERLIRELADPQVRIRDALPSGCDRMGVDVDPKRPQPLVGSEPNERTGRAPHVEQRRPRRGTAGPKDRSKAATLHRVELGWVLVR